MIRIYLAGRVGIENDGRYVGEARLAGNQGRLVFACLALQYERPTSRTEIADLIWGDAIADGWERALSAIVSKLRAALGEVGIDPERLSGAAGWYQLRLPSDIWIDLQAAERNLEMARTLIAAGSFADAYGWALSSSMICARPFLAGEDRPWVEHKRRLLAALGLEASAALVDIYLAQGQFTFALKSAETLVANDELDETGYRLLMRVHQQLGNPAGAARAYERCRLSLRRELGIEPSERTQRLYHDVVGGSG